jgi:hypothetical protein
MVPPRRQAPSAASQKFANFQRRGWPGLLLPCLVFSVSLLQPAATPLGAQELDPRALQNLPVGTDFVIAATGYSRGNLLVDPILPIEGARADVWNLTCGFMHVLDVFGKNGRVHATVPFATGQWEAMIAGTDSSTNRTGMGDPRIGFSYYFAGAPALTRAEFRSFRQTTIAGANLNVSVPLGQYDPNRLVNLGSNRWTIAPRLGISHAFSLRWTAEAYLGATFFTANNENYRGTKLTQEPFLEVDLHGIYMIRVPGVWVAASAGYGWGGATTISGERKESVSNTRASLAFRMPLSPRSGLKLAYINGVTTSAGTDFDTIQLAYQHELGR